jgi:hypothetical protein
MIHKIEKAKRYAQEPDRVTIEQLQVRFRGGNEHVVMIKNDHWSCDCHFFHDWQTCSHVMALQRLLAPMLSHTSETSSHVEVPDESALLTLT